MAHRHVTPFRRLQTKQNYIRSNRFMQNSVHRLGLSKKIVSRDNYLYILRLTLLYEGSPKHHKNSS